MPYEILEATKQSAFFVVLCKQDDHSFVCLGLDNGQEKLLLGLFGKGISSKDDVWYKQCVGVPAYLHDSRLHDTNPHEISYKAYHISYEEYVRTLSYLQKVERQSESLLCWRHVSKVGPALNYDEVCQYLDHQSGFLLYGDMIYYLNIAQRQVRAYSVAQSQVHHFFEQMPANAPKRVAPADFYALFSEETGIALPTEPLSCYCPVSYGQRVIFTWETLAQATLEHSSEPTPKDIKQFKEFSPINTCRHAAIDLTRVARGMSSLGRGIYSFYKMALPLKTSFLRNILGRTNEYIFILPLRPETYERAMPHQQYVIIKKLYDRLDAMVMIAQDNSLTREKFEEIKKLYVSIASKTPADMQPIFKEIEDFVNTHKGLINAHRREHWISFPTATRRLFNDILPPKASTQPTR